MKISKKGSSEILKSFWRTTRKKNMGVNYTKISQKMKSKGWLNRGKTWTIFFKKEKNFTIIEVYSLLYGYCLLHKYILIICKLYVDTSKDFRYIFYLSLSSWKYFYNQKLVFSGKYKKFFIRQILGFFSNIMRNCFRWIMIFFSFSTN